MSSNTMLNEAKFWEVIKYLMSLNAKTGFDEICLDLEITKRQLNSFVNFLKDVDYQFQLEKVEKSYYFKPETDQQKISMEFTLFEWLQFQAHFPALAQCKEKPYHKELEQKLAFIEGVNSHHDLFEPAMTLEQVLDSQKLGAVEKLKYPRNEIIAFIEESILDQSILSVHMNGKSTQVLPRRMVYLDGDLNLVGEDLTDQCLTHIPVSFMTQVYEDNIEYVSMYSPIEVEDFVSSIRAISENEIRLVLKVYNKEQFDLNMPNHHLSNPCIFTNAEGDYIWAASIEPHEEIFDWISSLGRYVEILDPTDFKKEYLNYCEDKLKKLA